LDGFDRLTTSFRFWILDCQGIKMDTLFLALRLRSGSFDRKLDTLPNETFEKKTHNYLKVKRLNAKIKVSEN